MRHDIGERSSEGAYYYKVIIKLFMVGKLFYRKAVKTLPPDKIIACHETAYGYVSFFKLRCYFICAVSHAVDYYRQTCISDIIVYIKHLIT